MRKHVIAAATALALGIGATANGTIAFIGGAIAAETGTKTMPDSSVIHRQHLRRCSTLMFATANTIGATCQAARAITTTGTPINATDSA